MNETTDSLLEFPCDFPLKVMGLHSAEFRDLVGEIVTRHAQAEESATRLSRDGKYMSISFVVRAESREQLDGLYRELSASDEVLFTL